MENRIVLAREYAGLTQKELAYKLGISPSTLNGYEKGNHDPKSVGLIGIAKICNVTTDKLLHKFCRRHLSTGTLLLFVSYLRIRKWRKQNLWR